MAASCGSASGALPLRTEQCIPENHRKPLSRSRTAQDHDKDQPFAAYLNGSTDLSLNPQIRHPRNRNSSGSTARAGTLDRPGCGKSTDCCYCKYTVVYLGIPKYIVCERFTRLLLRTMNNSLYSNYSGKWEDFRGDFMDLIYRMHRMHRMRMSTNIL